MSIFATFNIDSCSIALGENFSISLRQSIDLGIAEEGGRELEAVSVMGSVVVSSTSLTRYMRRVPVLSPTMSLSPKNC